LIAAAAAAAGALPSSYSAFCQQCHGYSSNMCWCMSDKLMYTLPGQF
jgi:cytochrome c5